MLSWEPINDRIITMRLQATHTKVTIIQVYAPTNAASDQDKNECYEQLQDILNAAPKHDLKIIMGDFNSQIGTDNTGWEDTIGRQAMEERTDNGDRLLSICSTNKMKTGGSLFMARTKTSTRVLGGHQMDELSTKSTISASHEGGQHHCRMCETTEEKISKQFTTS
jgi:hypothetical protein